MNGAGQALHHDGRFLVLLSRPQQALVQFDHIHIHAQHRDEVAVAGSKVVQTDFHALCVHQIDKFFQLLAAFRENALCDLDLDHPVGNPVAFDDGDHLFRRIMLRKLYAGEIDGDAFQHRDSAV